MTSNTKKINDSQFSVENFFKDVPHIYIKVYYKKDKETGKYLLNGEGKKIKGVYNELNNATLEQIKTHPRPKGKPTHISLFLKYTNIYVIDIDEKGIFPDWCTDFPNTTSTSGDGYHFFIRCDDCPDYINEKNVFNDFKGDLLHTKLNSWEMIKRKVSNVDIDKPNYIPLIKFEEIKPYLNIEAMNIRGENKTPTKPKVTKKDKGKEPSKTQEPPPPKKGGVYNPFPCLYVSVNRLERALVQVPTKFIKNTDSWYILAMAIYNTLYENNNLDLYPTILHKFSKRAKNYTVEGVDQYIKTSKYYEDGNKYGSIMEYVKKNKNFGGGVEYITETYEDLKEFFELRNFKLMRPPRFYNIDEDGEEQFFTSKDLNTTFSNLFCCVYDGKKEEYVRKSFIKMWVLDPKMKTYESFKFMPNMEKNKKYNYNLFLGLEGKNDWDGEADIQPILDHVKIITNHDEKVYNYVLNWVAQIIQQPDVLSRTALLFKSDEGAGKNIFWSFIGNKIIGKSYYYSTAKGDDIFDKFAQGLKHRLLVNLDETNGKDTFTNSDLLKNLITEPTITYQAKHINTVVLNNYTRFIFTTNNATAIKLGLTDRRYQVVECSEELVKTGDDELDKPKVEYFNKLGLHMERLDVQYAFFNFLMKRDISGFSFEADRVKGTLYKEMQYVSVPISAKFLNNFVDESKKDKIRVMAKDLYYDFKHFYKTNGYKADSMQNFTQFGRDIKGYGGVEKKRNNKGMIYIIDKKEVIKYLTSKNMVEEVEETEEQVDDDSDSEDL